ncbi:MarR family transcriptional regulator [Nocardia sp. NBC_01499]|uniref:MarR family winged helix-turn-helix transcriptional regulator n=1 Tax=Nocardia sp. NBC_01499 TaxID=2903597 RepID=UPI003865BC01
MVESIRSDATDPNPDPVTCAVAAFRDLATSLDLLDQVAATRLGVARSDLRCLDVLNRQGPLPAGALAKAVGLSASALSAALRRLETLDYIRREHDPRDRRIIRVIPTESAATATSPLFSRVRTATTAILTDLDPTELSAISRITNTLANAIQAIAATDLPLQH